MGNFTSGQTVRDELVDNRIWDTSAEYFVNYVGSLTWQLTRIKCGMMTQRTAMFHYLTVIT